MANRSLTLYTLSSHTIDIIETRNPYVSIIIISMVIPTVFFACIISEISDASCMTSLLFGLHLSLKGLIKGEGNTCIYDSKPTPMHVLY